MQVEVEQEADGRWIAEVPVLPGAMCSEVTNEEAVAKVEKLALAMFPAIMPQDFVRLNDPH